MLPKLENVLLQVTICDVAFLLQFLPIHVNDKVKQFKYIYCEKAAQELYGVDILLAHFCKCTSGIYSLQLVPTLKVRIWFCSGVVIYKHYLPSVVAAW